MNSYYDLLDAPYIREAETNGIPERKLYKCPICGEEYPERFYLSHGEIVGCECCLNMVYAEDYLHDHDYLQGCEGE